MWLCLFFLFSVLAQASPEFSSLSNASYPRFAKSPAGDLYLSWIEGETILRFGRVASIAKEKGTPIAKTENLFVNFADFPSLFFLDEKNVYAHWLERLEKNSGAYDVVIGFSNDGGKSWKRLGPVRKEDSRSRKNYDGFASFAKEGNLARVFWIDGRKSQSHEITALRTALLQGDTLQASQELDPDICPCCATAAASVEGKPIVVYRGHNKEEFRDVQIVRRLEKGWSNPAHVSKDKWKLLGCPVNGPGVAVLDRTVAVGWFTAAGGVSRALLSFSTDGGASFEPAMEVSQSGNVIGRVSLVPISKDEVLVGWLAREGTKQKLFLRKVQRGGKMSAVKEVSEVPGGHYSGFPQLALGSDGLWVAFTEGRAAKKVRVGRVDLPN